MVILYFGDIFGRPGRKAVAKALPDLRAQYSPDFIIGNAENLAGGRGVNRRTFQEMVSLGFHGLTSGNHIWDNREVYALMEQDDRILRPANYPSPSDDLRCPGKGFKVFRGGGKALLVVNVLGRVFMDAVECPFGAVDRILAENPSDLPILVDMHADATSEKTAMGWYLDGRVSAVVGSHSHVQTADERILPKGTAYITDVGLSGSFDSAIGMRPEEVIKRFRTRRHFPFVPSKDGPGVSCVVIQVASNNKAQSIERLRFRVELDDSGVEGDGE